MLFKFQKRMIDLLKQYKQLQNATGYAGSLRYYLARKKLDTLFLKWLSENKGEVEGLLKLAQTGKLKIEEHTPLFSHHRVPHQNTGSSSILSSTMQPPRSSEAKQGSKKKEIDLQSPNKTMKQQSLLSKTLKQKMPTESIPQFYFPNGIGSRLSDPVTDASVRAQMNTIFGNKNQANIDGCKNLVTKILGLPSYFSCCVLSRCASDTKITKLQFNRLLKQIGSYDLHKKAFNLLSTDKNKKFLTIDNLKKIIKEVLAVHPGLAFLVDSSQFQNWYSICVVNRMFFMANEKNDFQMSFREFRKSRILQSFFDIENEDDINENRDFFSYQDFYVIYIKFWELDNDHDFFLTKEELSKYSGYTLSRKTLDRIFSQIAHKFQHPQKMTFGDFVWFIFCVEDKTTDQSIKYWFKILDLDNNGIVSGYELQYFYEEQAQRMAYMDSNSNDFNFQNIICQMVDLMHPKNGVQFEVTDFLNRKLQCGLFINFLTDLNKLVAYEQRDAYQQRNQKNEHPEWTEWDRFSRPEYKRMQMQNDNDEGEQMLDWQNDD